MQNTYAIGIDVGGTNTDLGLVRDDSKIVSRRSLPTGNYALIEPYVQDIIDQIKEMLAEGDPEAGVTSIRMDELTGIGMGAPNGNFYTGCVEWAPNLPIRGLLDFQKEFGKHTSIPFVLSNDANAAAYGEYVYGGAKGMEHFIMITLGTGVGSGIVVDGRLVHGSTGTAGELGHNILIPNGRRCTCGRKGCLETYTSARGIVQTYIELRNEKGVPQEAPRMKGWITNWLGLACANACTFSAPEAIFLMGGPTKVGEPLLQPLREAFEENLLNIYKGRCEIRMSELATNEVAILGAAALIKLKK